VEQLLSRTISDRDVRGQTCNEHLRVAATIQLSLGVLFAILALALRHPLKDKLLNGSSTLYWVLIGAVLGYAASYFARGYLAGHRRFGLYGGLVFMEAMSRCMFALVVTVGLFSGQSVVALGMVAAPLLSLSSRGRCAAASAPPPPRRPTTPSPPRSSTPHLPASPPPRPARAASRSSASPTAAASPRLCW
jgi:hypothetical protein